ncbi:MAG: BolA family transcriptional regulator [Bdellovibrionales bacterium]|nr:BolA family transcriptional regulator [Bdellovibrionales bacterium]
MSISLDDVQKKVLARFPGGQVSVRDMTGGGDHLEIVVVSELFEGVNRIGRHRMVYEALGSAVGAEIHAAKLVTRAPGEE